MPDNIYVWIVAIVVLGLIIGLALFWGRGLIFTKENGKYKIETKEKQIPDTRTNEISVAREIQIKDSEVGDMAGRKTTSLQPLGDRSEHIDVARKATVERSKVGDIVGIKQRATSRTDEEKKE